jgi:hypothetical protein
LYGENPGRVSHEATTETAKTINKYDILARISLPFFPYAIFRSVGILACWSRSILLRAGVRAKPTRSRDAPRTRTQRCVQVRIDPRRVPTEQLLLFVPAKRALGRQRFLKDSLAFVLQLEDEFTRQGTR